MKTYSPIQGMYGNNGDFSDYVLKADYDALKIDNEKLRSALRNTRTQLMARIYFEHCMDNALSVIDNALITTARGNK